MVLINLMLQVVGIGRFVEKTKVSGGGDFLWGGFVVGINSKGSQCINK